MFSQYKDIEGFDSSWSDVNMNECQCAVGIHFPILLKNAAIASFSFLIFPLCVCACVSVYVSVCVHMFLLKENCFCSSNMKFRPNNKPGIN